MRCNHDPPKPGWDGNAARDIVAPQKRVIERQRWAGLMSGCRNTCWPPSKSHWQPSKMISPPWLMRATC